MMEVLRRYAHGFVNSHDFTVARKVMSEDYTLHVGTETLVGRDDHYLPAVQRQMDQFPQLGYSIHELVTDGEKTAVLFSEHGRSSRHTDRAASWIGMGIYRASAGRLVECWVEQDHYGKRRQLQSGECDPIPTVAIDPWSDHENADPSASDAVEEAVRSWLSRLRMWPPVDADLDSGFAQDEQPRVRVAETELIAVVAEHGRVGFNAKIVGSYAGGLPDTDGLVGRRVETWVGAIGSLSGGTVKDLRGASNRLAVQRQLNAME